MRIIAGKHKKRTIEMVGSKDTRETSDKVRGAIFNMIGQRPLGVCLDLFAGSGAYGLEALSRGAEKVYFIDHQKKAIETIKANIKTLGEEENASLFLSDYQVFIKHLSKDVLFDTVFIDPPYEMTNYMDIIITFAEHLNDDAMIIVESSKKVHMPDSCMQFLKIKEKTYGIKKVSIYK